MTINQELLIDYVMGALTPEEEREVATYLNEHPDQAAEVRDLFELLADVALSEEPVELPETAETSLLERIRQSDQSSTSNETLSSTTEQKETNDVQIDTPSLKTEKPDLSIDMSEIGVADAEVSQKTEGGEGLEAEARVESIDAEGSPLNKHLPSAGKTTLEEDGKTKGHSNEVEAKASKMKSTKIDEDFFDRVLTLPKDEKQSEEAIPPVPRVWLGLALAAAIAVFLYLGFQPRELSIEQQLAQVCQEQNTVCEPISLETSTESGTLARRENNSLFVVLENDPPTGQVYQAWEIVEGTPQSLGVWNNRVMNITRALAEDSVFGITIEPPGGSPQPTSTPIVIVPLS